MVSGFAVYNPYQIAGAAISNDNVILETADEFVQPEVLQSHEIDVSNITRIRLEHVLNR